MPENYRELLPIMNNIRDDLWVGDFRAVQTTATEVRNDRRFTQLKETWQAGHDTIWKVRQQTRYQREDYEAKFGDLVRLEFEKNEISFADYVVGTLVRRIEVIQANLAKVKIAPVVFHAKSYKYSIHPRGTMYEAHAVLLPENKPNIGIAGKLAALVDGEYSAVEGEHSLAISIFSKLGYVRILSLPRITKVEVTLREPAQAEVQRLVEEILAILANPDAKKSNNQADP